MKLLLLPVLLFSIFNACAQPMAKPVKASKTPYEKVYLHTDRDIYLPGDTLFYKAYLVNAADNRLIGTGKDLYTGNLYVEIIAPDATIIDSQLIRVLKGLGNGDFDLPDSLPAGSYRLRAYSNWMRNFGDSFLFEKNISIMAFDARPEAGKTTGLSSENVNSNQTVASVAPAIIVRFYPEGGSLINSISSLVAVKAEDAANRGIAVNGTVISSSGDTAARFITDSSGMGSFMLSPKKENIYHAVIALNGQSVRIALPASLNEGLSLQASQAENKLHVAITNSLDLPSGSRFKYTINIAHDGQSVFNQKLQATDRQVAIDIPSAALPEGIGVVTLLDEQERPNCQRLIYVHRPESNGPQLTLNKKIFGTNEQVTVEMDVHQPARLSLAAIDADLYSDELDDIVPYLMLGSEIKGYVERVQRYFDPSNADRFKQLDLLLMTQGWRDYIWKQFADSSVVVKYPVENGIEVPGRVIDADSNKPMPKLNMSLYAPNATGLKLFSRESGAEGRFRFTGLLLERKQTLTITALDSYGRKKGFIIADEFVPPAVKSIPTGIFTGDISPVARIAIQNRAIEIKNSRVSGTILLPDVKVTRARSGIVTRDQNLFSPWGPEQAFDITAKDYEFKTLEWFLLQRSNGAMKSQEVNLTGVVYPGEDTIKTLTGMKITAPFFFVNGQELYMGESTQAEAYRNTYFNMPMQNIKKIVVKRMKGSLTGSSSIKTVDRYMIFLTLIHDAINVIPGTLELQLRGFYNARSFYIPLENEKQLAAQRLSTVYWQPNIVADNKGKASVSFSNIGSNKAVKIIIQGVGIDGTPISAVTGYTRNAGQ